MAKAKDPIVIVGGGRAAASLVDAYREAGGEALITILSAETHPPYNRPPLSKFVLRGEMPPEDALVHAAEEYEDQLVELRLETAVESVDPDAHTVTLAGGETVPYGTLVIACGARPRTLSVPAPIFPPCTRSARSTTPSRRREALEARKALVVGGSFIGSEVAASLRMLGLEVTIVELGERLVPALGSPELSEQVADLYREQGVELLLGEQIEELRANGRMLVGAAPRPARRSRRSSRSSESASSPRSGSSRGRDRGRQRHRRRRPLPRVGGGRVRDRRRRALRRRRRRASSGGSSTGRTPTPRGSISVAASPGRRTPTSEVAVFFTKMFDLQLQVLGDPDGGVDEVVLRGSIAERNLLGLYLRDERLVGAVVVGQGADMVEELTMLLRDQPELGDRSHLATDGVRPAAVFAA